MLRQLLLQNSRAFSSSFRATTHPASILRPQLVAAVTAPTRASPSLLPRWYSSESSPKPSETQPANNGGESPAESKEGKDGAPQADPETAHKQELEAKNKEILDLKVGSLSCLPRHCAR
jgi:hypothetical protein